MVIESIILLDNVKDLRSSYKVKDGGLPQLSLENNLDMKLIVVYKGDMVIFIN